jgi:hypothetical protein
MQIIVILHPKCMTLCRNAMKPLDITEVARRSGLPASTLRFYEENGNERQQRFEEGTVHGASTTWPGTDGSRSIGSLPSSNRLRICYWTIQRKRTASSAITMP